jgi:hypothetical protein
MKFLSTYGPNSGVIGSPLHSSPMTGEYELNLGGVYPNTPMSMK